MILDALPFALLALGVGVALASAPGPVQAVIVTEAVRGGLRRGFDAVLGASVTFTVLLAAVALGFSMASPEGRVLDLLRVVGGGWLLWLAWDGARSGLEPTAELSSSARSSMTRGVLSVVVNPGAWLFVGTVAAPLLASAGVAAGLGGALLVVGAFAGGAASGDVLIVLASALGLHTLGERARRAVNRVLHLLLGGVGGWLLVAGLAALLR